MAEKKGFFDHVEGVPNYDSSEFGEALKTISDGVSYNYLNELNVTPGDGLQVKVDSGCLWSRGKFYIQDEPADGVAPKTLSIDAATSGYLRIDRCVVEFDIENETAAAKIVKGIEAVSSPTTPALLDTETKWQVSLFKVNVSGGTITGVESERVIGNGRTNPNFAESVINELTVEKVILQDGGKIYIASLNTYIYLSGGKLLFKADNDCAEVQLIPCIYGTANPPTSGTYPAGTVYIKHGV